MLPDDCPLRHLPVGLNSKQSLSLNAMVFTSDILSHACSQLEKRAERLLKPERADADRSDRTAMFLEAWAAIDAIYAARKLLRVGVSGDFGPQTRAWYEETLPACEMRNLMDHLSARLGNLAGQTTKGSPLFGVVTAMLVDPPSVGGARRVEVLSIASGQRPAGVQWKSPTIDRESPADGLTLWFEANGATVNLTKANEGLIDLLSGHADDVREDIQRQAAELSEIDRDILLKSGGFDAAFRVSFTFDP